MTAQPPVGGLIAELAAALSRLVKGEIALAKAEGGAVIRALVRAAVFGLFALAFGVTALNLLAQAAAAGLVRLGMSPGLALLATAIGFALCAGIAAALARAAIQRSRRHPVRIARNLKHDFNTFKASEKEDG